MVFNCLRIWDANLIKEEALEDIDRLYSCHSIIQGLTSLKNFYPLTGKNIQNNVLKDVKFRS